jgi:hypothetical protein
MFAMRSSGWFPNRRRARMQRVATVGFAAASAALAAAAVYFLDPSSGKRRRQQLSDSVARASREGRDVAAKLGRDTYKRASGMYRRSKRHLHSVAGSSAF